MAELNVDKMAKEVAEKALDDYVYQGKTIREWIAIIAKNAWIPVSEILPEKDGEYLTTMKYIGKATGTIYIDVEETFFDAGKSFNVGVNEEVIAWMPLPEPYKAESEDKV